jgi:acyl-CoA thioesterase-1
VNYLSGIVALLQKEWPRNRTVNIACHGHSVPAGYFRTPVVDAMSAYPHLLRIGLARRFPCAVINVIVTAVGGENSESGAARFASEVLAHRPDVLTIDYGLNDRGIGLERARQAWSSMIGAALERGIKVILLTPTADVAASFDNPDDLLFLHAEQIRSLAQEHDVALVDSLAVTKRAIQSGVPLRDLMSQDNHPNRRGHELVAEELLKLFAA